MLESSSQHGVLGLEPAWTVLRGEAATLKLMKLFRLGDHDLTSRMPEW